MDPKYIMDLKNNRKYVVSVIICISVVILMIIVNRQIVDNSHSDSNSAESGYIFLTDNYDSDGYSFYDFLADENSYKILENTYSKVSESRSLNYLEVADQSMEYIGEFVFNQKLTDADTMEQIKQIDNDGKYFSTLKSLQLSKKAMEEFGIEVPDGVEWEYQGNMNILMGDYYRKYFQEGEKITLRYLGEKTIDCTICGFIQKGKKVSIDTDDYDIDYYIITPSIELEERDNQEYRQILLSVKCEGVIKYNSIEEKENAVKALKQISGQTGYQYAFRGEYNELFD